MRVVVLGGYGNFGARICRALAGYSGIEVVAAGRDPDRSSRNARLDTRILRAQLDLDSRGFAAGLKSLSPNVVIHCAGPFQGQDYRVVSAAISAGAHYIDMADGRDFVARFAKRVDPAARTARLLAVSGASTLPALSSAVIDGISARLRSVEEIRIAIAPGQRAPRGAATMAAVISYAGKRFKWLRGGAWADAWGWQELRRARFARLGARWAAACDVPDLALFPERYPGVRTVEFRAALEVGIQHFFLWIAAALSRAGAPLPIERWSRPLNKLASLLEVFGSDRGGMMVSLVGTRADGSRARVEWHLTAYGDDGPEIPCMAAVLMTRKIARGEISTRGAFPCMGFLTLADFEREFAQRRITTVIREGDA